MTARLEELAAGTAPGRFAADGHGAPTRWGDVMILATWWGDVLRVFNGP